MALLTPLWSPVGKKIAPIELRTQGETPTLAGSTHGQNRTRVLGLARRERPGIKNPGRYRQDGTRSRVMDTKDISH